MTFTSNKYLCKLCKKLHSHIKFEYKIALLYLAVSILWIVFSDKFLVYLFVDNATLTKYQTVKGIAFVFATALLLFILIRRYTKKINKLSEKYKEVSDNWQTTFNAISDVVMLLDEDFKILEINEAGTKFMTKKQQQFIGKKCHSLLHGTDTMIKDCPETKSKQSAKPESTTYSEGDKHYELSSWPVFDSQNRIKAFAHIIKDITEIVNYRRSIAEQKKLFETMFHAIPDTIFLTNAQKQITLYNKAFEAMFGKTESGISHRNLQKLRYDNGHNQRFKIANSSLASDTVYTCLFVNKNSEKFTGEMFSAALHDANNHEIGTIHIVRDISDRIQYINDLKTARENAEESDRLKTVFMQNLSHEIRTPLNAIVGFTQIMAHTEIGKNKHLKYANIIQKAGSQLIETIENTLMLALLQNNQVSVDKVMFSPIRLLSDLYEEYTKTHIHYKININKFLLNVPEDKSCLLNTDRSHIKQILKILIDNAFKFTQNGTIELECYPQKDKVYFTVKDTGIGISKKNMDRVLKSFTQADDEIQKTFGGLGLGLPIAQGLTRLLGGELIIRTKENKGTKVTVIFNAHS